jgi:hypothetical protein
VLVHQVLAYLGAALLGGAAADLTVRTLLDFDFPFDLESDTFACKTRRVTILPSGPVPPAVPFAIAVAVVMVLGFAIDAVSLAGLVIVCVAAFAYACFTWRAGTSGGSPE